MAGDNLNVWYDPEGDHLEIVFDQKAGQFEDTSLENVMQKRDAEGNLLSVSIFNLSSFAGTRPHPESTADHGLWAVFNLDVDDPDSFEFDVALGYERLGVTAADVDRRGPLGTGFADLAVLRPAAACAETLPAPAILGVPSRTASRGASASLPCARCFARWSTGALPSARSAGHSVPRVREEAPCISC
jgi:hypothetical protein